MQKKKINDTTYAVEKLKATDGFKLQLKVVKLLGGGIFDALQGNDLAKIGEMKTDKLFEAHMDDKLLDIFKVAIFVLEVNLKNSIGGLKSLMPSPMVKQK